MSSMMCGPTGPGSVMTWPTRLCSQPPPAMFNFTHWESEANWFSANSTGSAHRRLCLSSLGSKWIPLNFIIFAKLDSNKCFWLPPNSQLELSLTWADRQLISADLIHQSAASAWSRVIRLFTRVYHLSWWKVSLWFYDALYLSGNNAPYFISSKC